MRALTWLGLVVALGGVSVLAGCHVPQAGCSIENCQAMVEACRVEFQGGPAALAICTGFDRPPGPVDWSPYCVDACNAHAGNGKVAACVAGKADECRGARDAGKTLDQVIAPCLESTDKAALKSCDDTCTAERKACDDACSGGKPCDSCLRAGRSDCASLCTDAGYSACLDCSSQCGLKYVDGSDRCPREP